MNTEDELRATIQTMANIVGDLVAKNAGLSVVAQQVPQLKTRVAELESALAQKAAKKK